MSALKDKDGGNNGSFTLAEEIAAMEATGIKIIRELGSGTYGIVYEADIDGSLEAIKLVRPRQGKISYPSEFDIMARVINKYVLYTEGAFFPSTINGIGTIITMPLAYDTAIGITTEPFYKRSFFRKLAEGINCLHRCGILHLDIKAANVLVFDNEITVKSDNPNVSDKTYQVPEPMIGDFGLSRTTRSVIEGEFIPAAIGTISYRAPEHFDGYTFEAEDVGGVNEVGSSAQDRTRDRGTVKNERFIYRGSSDVWGYGITVLTVLTGVKVFPIEVRNNGYQRDEVFDFLYQTFRDKSVRRRFLANIIYGENGKGIKPKERDLVIDLLNRTLEWDYRKRITMAEVIDHPWFKGIITPISSCQLLAPEWPLTPKAGTETLIRDIVKYALSILIDGEFKSVGISVLFHVVDIIYRFGAYNDLDTLIDQQFKIDLAFVAISIGLKYKGYRITEESFIKRVKDILDRFNRGDFKYKWSWERLLEMEEAIYNNFSLIIYRRFLYDSATSVKDLIEYYQEYILKPENYYKFDPHPVDPLRFKNLEDPFFAYKTIKEFFK